MQEVLRHVLASPPKTCPVKGCLCRKFKLVAQTANVSIYLCRVCGEEIWVEEVENGTTHDQVQTLQEGGPP